MRLSRRQFIYAASATAAVAGTGLYTWSIEPHWLDLVVRPLWVRKPAARLRRSDPGADQRLQVGPRVDNGYVLSVFERVAALRPDIVVLTGDLVSYHDGVFEQMEAVYRHFPRGRLATVGIPGNHDYGPGWSHPEIAEQVVTIAERHGIAMLRNRVCEIEGLQIIGLDDLWDRSPDLRPPQRFGLRSRRSSSAGRDVGDGRYYADC